MFLSELAAKVKNAMPAPAPANGKIVALSMSRYYGMAQPYDYHLREEGGQVLFSATAGFRDEIKLDNAVAAKEDMEILQALCDDYVYMPGKYERPPETEENFVVDASRYTTNITWENGTKLESEYSSNGESALLAFFHDLSRRLSTPPAQGRVISLELSSNDGGMYHLREADGKILFDVALQPYNNDEYREINLIRVEASRVDMDAVNAICGEHGLAEIQHSYRPPMPHYFQNIAGNRHGVSFTVKWENCGWFHADCAYGSEEALTAYLWELALRLDAEK